MKSMACILPEWPPTAAWEGPPNWAPVAVYRSRPGSAPALGPAQAGFPFTGTVEPGQNVTVAAPVRLPAEKTAGEAPAKNETAVDTWNTVGGGKISG